MDSRSRKLQQRYPTILFFVDYLENEKYIFSWISQKYSLLLFSHKARFENSRINVETMELRKLIDRSFDNSFLVDYPENERYRYVHVLKYSLLLFSIDYVWDEVRFENAWRNLINSSDIKRRKLSFVSLSNFSYHVLNDTPCDSLSIILKMYRSYEFENSRIVDGSMQKQCMGNGFVIEKIRMISLYIYKEYPLL